MSRSAAEHVSDDPTSPWWAEHVARYRFASQIATGRVLDVACGAGLGFQQLDRNAVVIAGDIDRLALDEARETSPRATVALCQLDVTCLPIRPAIFDAVTCFETIEHVSDDEALVAELGRVVRPDGVVLISTPNADVSSNRHGQPKNPFHIREYLPAELDSLLRSTFADVQLLGQSPPGDDASPFFAPEPGLGNRFRTVAAKVAIRLPPPVRTHLLRRSVPMLEDWTFSPTISSRSHVLLAVCRRPSLGLAVGHDVASNGA